MLLGGRLADRVGRRRIFVVGVAVFCAASIALASPSSLSLVLEQFPASRRPSAIATWSGFATMGAANA